MAFKSQMDCSVLTPREAWHQEKSIVRGQLKFDEVLQLIKKFNQVRVVQISSGHGAKYEDIWTHSGFLGWSRFNNPCSLS